jgi:hypothetical protein
MGYLGTKPADALVTTAQISDGAVQTADIANSAVTQTKLATGVAGTGPAFSAYQSSNQSITSSTFTKVTLDTELFDTNSNFSSNRFTPTVAGYYQINGAVNCAPSTSASRCLSFIFKNGSSITQGSDNTVASSIGQSVVSYLAYLNGTTDYLELYAYITATTPIIYGASTATYFTGALVRSA